MKRFVLAALVGLLMIAACVVPSMGKAAAVSVNVGDYWKYSASAVEEGLSVTATEKMAVTGTEGSGANEVYVIALSGSGDVSGNYGGYSISGSVTISGEQKRLTSNFSLISSDLKEDMKITMMGESAKMVLETSQTFSPAMDDYVGDNNLGPGDVAVSRSQVTSTVSISVEVNGESMPFSQTLSNEVEVTMQMGMSNQSVTVGAGTYDCNVITYTVAMAGTSVTMTYYYSAAVGNYVKATGSYQDISVEVGMLGGAGELKAFAFGGKGAGSSGLSASTMMILAIVVVLVVVVVLAVLLMRRRGRNAVTLNVTPPESAWSGLEPPQSGSPPPPSSGPGPGA